MNIVLVGFKSCGKSALGRILAEKMNRPFLDTDDLLEKCYAEKTGQKLLCREIFSILGEKEFRSFEKEVLLSLQGEKKAVISTGGGLAAIHQNIALLRSLGCVVFIDTALPVIEQRLGDRKIPLFSEKSCADLFNERRPIYLEVADIVFPVVQHQSPESVAILLLECISRQMPRVCEQHHCF